MNYTSTRMYAYCLDFDLIEVRVSKQYYQGIIESLYICEKKNTTPLVSTMIREDDSYCYYQAQYQFDICKVYEILNSYGLRVVLEYIPLVYAPAFDAHFYYEGNDLGTLYTPFETIWKVWAPTAISMNVCIHYETEKLYKSMDKKSDGTFSVTLQGDYEGVRYTYLVNHGHGYYEALDPYAYTSSSNGKDSLVVDIEHFKYKSEPIKRPAPTPTPILYEINIRDFVSDPTIQCTFPELFLGVTERNLRTPEGNLAGIDYLLSLGVTHVQIMPMFDFATVNEEAPALLYNWGYDPLQYGIPEGSYSSHSDNPYCRVEECRQMISRLHALGLRVVMDVVYNHVYDISYCAFEQLVPNYFLRQYPNHELSDAAWCGNEVNTEAKMVRKYLIDMSVRWQTLYGIDGLRFDLMGLLDITTLTEIYTTCIQNDPGFIMYGEGWNMETALAYEQRAIQENHYKLPQVGFFNDYFRDTLKGKTGDMELASQGCFAGNMGLIVDASQCLLGTRYSMITQSINYVECHDNATVYDKFKISNGYENEVVRMKRQMLLTIACLLAQGIPFLHHGQECYRSKNGNTNSYRNKEDNRFPWRLVDTHKKDIDAIRKIIRIRKDFSEFWYASMKDVQTYVSAKCHESQWIEYVITHRNRCRSLSIYMNASMKSFPISTENKQLLFSTEDDHNMTTLPPLSILIFED